MDVSRSPQRTHDDVENHASTPPGASHETSTSHSARSSVGVYDRPKRTASPIIVIILAAIILLLILSAILAILIL